MGEHKIIPHYLCQQYGLPRAEDKQLLKSAPHTASSMQVSMAEQQGCGMLIQVYLFYVHVVLLFKSLAVLVNEPKLVCFGPS